MIKELLIVFVALLALCQAGPVEDSKPEVVPVVVPVESASDDQETSADGDDLAPDASAYWGYGRRGYYGGGWGRGWGGYGGGWGRGYGGGWGGGWGGYKRYYGGWGRGYGGYWG